MQQQGDHFTSEGIFVRLDANDEEKVREEEHRQQVHRYWKERVVLPHPTTPQCHQNDCKDLSEN
jgi:hypothetical protein